MDTFPHRGLSPRILRLYRALQHRNIATDFHDLKMGHFGDIDEFVTTAFNAYDSQAYIPYGIQNCQRAYTDSDHAILESNAELCGGLVAELKHNGFDFQTKKWLRPLWASPIQGESFNPNKLSPVLNLFHRAVEYRDISARGADRDTPEYRAKRAKVAHHAEICLGESVWSVQAVQSEWEYLDKSNSEAAKSTLREMERRDLKVVPYEESDWFLDLIYLEDDEEEKVQDQFDFEAQGEKKKG